MTDLSKNDNFIVVALAVGPETNNADVSLATTDYNLLVQTMTQLQFTIKAPNSSSYPDIAATGHNVSGKQWPLYNTSAENIKVGLAMEATGAAAGSTIVQLHLMDAMTVATSDDVNSKDVVSLTEFANVSYDEIKRNTILKFGELNHFISVMIEGLYSLNSVKVDNSDILNYSASAPMEFLDQELVSQNITLQNIGAVAGSPKKIPHYDARVVCMIQSLAISLKLQTEGAVGYFAAFGDTRFISDVGSFTKLPSVLNPEAETALQFAVGIDRKTELGDARGSWDQLLKNEGAPTVFIAGQSGDEEYQTYNTPDVLHAVTTIATLDAGLLTTNTKDSVILTSNSSAAAEEFTQSDSTRNMVLINLAAVTKVDNSKFDPVKNNPEVFDSNGDLVDVVPDLKSGITSAEVLEMNRFENIETTIIAKADAFHLASGEDEVIMLYDETRYQYPIDQAIQLTASIAGNMLFTRQMSNKLQVTELDLGYALCHINDSMKFIVSKYAEHNQALIDAAAPDDKDNITAQIKAGQLKEAKAFVQVDEENGLALNAYEIEKSIKLALTTILQSIYHAYCVTHKRHQSRLIKGVRSFNEFMVNTVENAENVANLEKARGRDVAVIVNSIDDKRCGYVPREFRDRSQFNNKKRCFNQGFIDDLYGYFNNMVRPAETALSKARVNTESIPSNEFFGDSARSDLANAQDDVKRTAVRNRRKLRNTRSSEIQSLQHANANAESEFQRMNAMIHTQQQAIIKYQQEVIEVENNFNKAVYSELLDLWNHLIEFRPS